MIMNRSWRIRQVVIELGLHTIRGAGLDVYLDLDFRAGEDSHPGVYSSISCWLCLQLNIYINRVPHDA